MAELPKSEFTPLHSPDQPEEELSLQQELLPDLTEEQQSELIAEVISDRDAAIQDREPWEQNLVLWEEQYLGILPDKSFPWPGASNFAVPITMLGVETLKPRLIEAILGEEPIIRAIPVEPTDEEQRDRVELLLNWQLHTQVSIEPLVEESAHRFLVPSTVVAKVLWREDWRKRSYIAHFPPETSIEQIFKEAFGEHGTPDLKPVSRLEWKGTLKSPGGPKRAVRVKFKFLEDEIQALIEREDVVYAGPRVDLIKPEDFIAPFQGGGNIQRLPWCQHRTWMSESDLRQKVRQGRFSEEAVEKLLIAARPTPESSQQDAQGIRTTRAQSEGVEVDAASSVRDQQFEILEDYRSRDIDEDGIDEEIVSWISPLLPNQLLGWDFLDNVYAHGQRPFVVGRYLALPDRFYSLSFPEVVRTIQEEINTIHNQRVDYGTIQNAPIYFFRSSSTHTNSIQRLMPGQGIPIDNPQQDILIPNWNGSPTWGFNEESTLFQMLERLTGISDLSLGRQPNRVGATRTATGVASLLSEAGLRFKTAMQSFQRFWVGIFEQILALDQQYLPNGVEFRVTGRWPEIIKIHDRSEIRGKFDLRLSATTETMNRQIMREDATVKLSTALNPVALQLGIIGLKGIRRLYREFYRAYGEIDPDLIIEPQREEVVLSPEQELAMFLAGQEREPTLVENLALHLETHLRQREDPVVQERLGPEKLALLDQHIAATLQLVQVQMVAQSMGQGRGESAAPVGGQAQNALIGQIAPEQPAGFGNGNLLNG